MYFITSMPRTSSNRDTIWVIVDKLTKFAHFVAIMTTNLTSKLARLYVEEIFQLDGGLFFVVLERDLRFASHF